MKMFNRMIDYALEKPEEAPTSVLVINLSRGVIEKILTPSRIELINVISRRKPKTVGELVKMVNRPKESVSRDLRILSNYGLLSFKKTGRQKAPKIEKELIAMPLVAHN